MLYEGIPTTVQGLMRVGFLLNFGPCPIIFFQGKAADLSSQICGFSEGSWVRGIESSISSSEFSCSLSIAEQQHCGCLGVLFPFRNKPNLLLLCTWPQGLEGNVAWPCSCSWRLRAKPEESSLCYCATDLSAQEA